MTHPLAGLPVLEVVAAIHIMAGITPGPGKAVHDCLA